MKNIFYQRTNLSNRSKSRKTSGILSTTCSKTIGWCVLLLLPENWTRNSTWKTGWSYLSKWWWSWRL